MDVPTSIALTCLELDRVQLNAYPPQPKAAVDLYKSHLFGDPGVSITMVLRSLATAGGEAPTFHIELFLGSSST